MKDYQKAEIDYINGMKYKEIADKYGKSINTIKSWKQRYKWNKNKDSVSIIDDSKSVQPKNKSMHTKHESVHTKSNDAHVEKFVEKQISISNESDLSDREEMFCYYYSQFPNQTKAYLKAFDTDKYRAAAKSAYELMKKPRIIKRIKQLKRGKQEMALLEVADIVNELKRQAFADIADFLEYGTEKVMRYDEEGKPLADPETGKQAFYYKNYVRFKEVDSTDTTLLKSVKLNKDGHVEVEMYDKQKALSELVKIINDKDVSKQKLEKMKAETEIVKAKAKILSDSDEKVTNAVETLLDAFSGAAKEVNDD